MSNVIEITKELMIERLEKFAGRIKSYPGDDILNAIACMNDTVWLLQNPMANVLQILQSGVELINPRGDRFKLSEDPYVCKILALGYNETEWVELDSKTVTLLDSSFHDSFKIYQEPPTEGTKEWALTEILNGDTVWCEGDNYQRFYLHSENCIRELIDRLPSKDYTIDMFQSRFPLKGWSIFVRPERCPDCGAGDDNHHSYTCSSGLHPDKIEQPEEFSKAWAIEKAANDLYVRAVDWPDKNWRTHSITAIKASSLDEWELWNGPQNPINGELRIIGRHPNEYGQWIEDLSQQYLNGEWQDVPIVKHDAMPNIDNAP